MQPLLIENATLTTALGAGMGAQWQALSREQSGLRRCDFEDTDLNTWIGRVDGMETIHIPPAQRAYDCRNNRLAELGLSQDGFETAVDRLRGRLGGRRIGVYLGSSTGGILSTEQAYRHCDPETGELPAYFNYRTTHNIYSLGAYVRERLQLSGPASVISTACSSSAKVFASAYRALRAGLCDAAVVGGVDSLCLTTLHGFNALQLLADEPCRPADAERRGISIGEAAGFALVRLARPGEVGTAVLGYGESSDAHHMSSPDPSGEHAAAAMQAALNRAGIAPARVDFVNLHGTGTPANDLSEDKALERVFGPGQAAASTKGWTGHALGAAGIVETLFCALCLEHGFLPKSLNTRCVDPALTSRILLQSEYGPADYLLSNAFGFGGSNASLVLGRLP
jgi:3-oxoacyl-[acyl-carrier-protein] synthase-1